MKKQLSAPRGRLCLALAALAAFPAHAAEEPVAPLSPSSAAVAPAAAPADTIIVKRSAVDIAVAETGEFVTTTTLEMVPANQSAVDAVAQTAVFYRESADTLEIVEAYTLKKDGRKLSVDTAAIFPQLPQGDTSMPMFNDMRQKVIVFPNVQAGDTVAYTTRTATHTPFFPGAFFESLVYPRTVSYGEVVVTVTAPKAKPLTLDVMGATVETTQQGDTITYTWRYSAPQSDPTPRTAVVSSLKETPRFLASTFKTYDELAHAYAALALPKAAVTPAIRARADEITAGITGKREQAKALHDWVSREIRYVSVGLGTGSIVPHDGETTLKNGYGDCKDKAVLLTALLAAKGIKSEIVLINAGQSYELSEAPGFVELNHAINWLPDFKLYTDTTSSLAPLGILPLETTGKPAVHVVASGAAVRATPVLRAGEASTVHRAEAQMDWTGRIAGTTRTTATGPFSIGLRGVADGIEAIGPEKAAEALLDQGTGTFKLAPIADLSPSYSIEGRFEAEMTTQVVSGYAFYMPPGYQLVDQTGDTLIGPLGIETLSSAEPTPCFTGTQVEELTLSPPPGLEVAKLPANVVLANPSFSYKTQWTQDGRKVMVRRELTSNVAGPLCTGALRQAAAGVLAAIEKDYDQTHIVLTRVDAKFGPATDADIAALDKAIAADPANPVAHANKGYAHATRKEPAAALSSFDKALELSPTYWAARVERARARLTSAAGAPAQVALAKDDLDEAIRLRPNSGLSYQLRGAVNQQLGDSAGAIADYTTAINVEPRNAAFYFGRAQARCDIFSRRTPTTIEGRKAMDAACKQSVSDLDEAIAIDKDFAQAYLLRAMTRLMHDDRDGALKDVQATTGMKEGDSQVEMMRAAVLSAGHFEQAAAAIDVLTAKNPENIGYRLAKASSQMDAGKFTDAEATIAEVLAVEPENRIALEMRGFIRYRARKYEEAIREFDRVVELGGARPQTYERRGTAHYARKDYDKAVADYKKVIELEPNYPEIQELLRDAEKSAAAAKAKGKS
ncbi:MAG: DUF3857 domain-containing protein [Rhodospirillaceae bacterium]